MSGKILPIEELGRQLDLRGGRSGVVLCHGVFDVIHPGHLRHLREAKELGNLLVVGITADRYVQKGPGRPVFTESERADHLAALEMVDYVVIDADPSMGLSCVRTLRPAFFVKGADHAVTGIPGMAEAAADAGSRIVFTTSALDSTSRVSTRAFRTYSDSTEAWLDKFRERHRPQEVDDALDAISGLRVLVVGDGAAPDTFTFVDLLSKVPGDAQIAGKIVRKVKSAGAVEAITSHLEGFASEVMKMTQRNLNGSDAFLADQECYAGLLLTVYKPAEPFFEPGEEDEIIRDLRLELQDADVAVVVDYGDFVTPRIRSVLEGEHPAVLAATVKAFFYNYGFNVASKYERMDYLCLTQLEEELARAHAHHRFPPGDLMVTMGNEGSVLHKEGERYFTPSLAVDVVDTIGAGDAMLALTALLTRRAHPELVGFLGSCAAALQCGIEINTKPVSPIELRKFAKRLLS